jgi:acyl-CoA thioester hydrolase
MWGMERFSESVLRVRYVETDQMGIAHHANYLAWYEIGRTDLCRLAGFSYRAIEERGYLLVVTEVTSRYRKPYRYDDEVIIQTSIDQIASRSIHFRYRLLDATRKVVHADGRTAHLWLDSAARKPVTAPGELTAAFERFRSSGGDSESS